MKPQADIKALMKNKDPAPWRNIMKKNFIKNDFIEKKQKRVIVEQK